MPISEIARILRDAAFCQDFSLRAKNPSPSEDGLGLHFGW
jgi:hypothetical protein